MANKPGTGPNNLSVLGPIISGSTVDVGSFRYEGNTNASSGKAPDPRVGNVGAGAHPGAAGGVSGTARPGTVVEVPAQVGAVVKTAGGSAGTPSGANAPEGTAPMVVRTRTPDAAIPSASLFGTRPEPGSRYLVETDSRFASYRGWLGSDYLLDRLGLDPERMHKRLGDGFYEQRLIREQIAQLTGSRYLEGYDGDEAQYAALMSAGATFAQQYGLRRCGRHR